MLNILRKNLNRIKSSGAYRALAGALNRFDEIDGEQRAAAFGYYAVFSIFPMVVLLVTVGSTFVEPKRAMDAILDYIREQLPLSKSQLNQITLMLRGIIEARGQAGIFALLVLLWGAMRFFYVLVRAVNCAWRTREYSWWRLPLQNLLMLAIVASAVVIGILGPVALEVVRNRVPGDMWIGSIAFDTALFLLPFAVLFYGFSMLYKLAPRRYTTFGEVWKSALLVTVLLRFAQYAFVFYVNSFGNFNALYGALGGIMALMLWIYISGYIVIVGACLCATGAVEKSLPDGG